MRKPTKLYRWEAHHKCYVHEVGPQCAPQVVEHRPEGTLWRCRAGQHDHYGWATRKEAKSEEIQRLREDILELNYKLNELTKSKGLKNEDI